MMNILKNKKILIGIAIIIVILLGYQMFFAGENNTGPSVVISSAGTQSETERDILRLLTDLRSVNLSHDLLDTKVFLSLKDYSVFIEEGPTGRRNPFEPVGGNSLPLEGQ